MQSIKTGKWAEAGIHGHTSYRGLSGPKFPGCDWDIFLDGAIIQRIFCSLDHWGCCFPSMPQNIIPSRPHPMPHLSSSWSHCVMYTCTCISSRWMRWVQHILLHARSNCHNDQGLHMLRTGPDPNTHFLCFCGPLHILQHLTQPSKEDGNKDQALPQIP